MSCFFFCIPTWATINQNNDVQLWISGDFRKTLSNQCSLDLTNEYRFGNDMSELFFIFLQGLFSYKFNPYVKIEPGYRQIWVKPDHWSLIYEPFAHFIFQNPGKWDVRNRIAYLIPELTKNVWLYRARIRLFGRWKVKGHELNPYLSNEFFVLSRGGFAQDRIIVGIFPKLYRHISGDFYYMLRLFKVSEGWRPNHVFGTRVDFKF